MYLARLFLKPTSLSVRGQFPEGFPDGQSIPDVQIVPEEVIVKGFRSVPQHVGIFLEQGAVKILEPGINMSMCHIFKI